MDWLDWFIIFVVIAFWSAGFYKWGYSRKCSEAYEAGFDEALSLKLRQDTINKYFEACDK